MTAPRQIVEGATYLITRRCIERQFLLKPTKTAKAVFLYVLALAVQRFEIQLHVFCALSNHFHLVVTDPHARLPAFLQFMNALVARAINASLGRWESVWAPDTYSAVKLVSRSDILEKCVYTLANPVAAGLVGTGSAWPGPWSAPDLIGGAPLLVKRPEHFFDPNGGMPDEIALPLTTPPGFESPAEFRRELERETAAQEDEARKRWHARGGFMGIARVMAQNPRGRPRDREPRRDLNPRIGARDKWKRIEALNRLVEFVQAYRAAWRARRSGKAEAVFPHGTYLLRVLHGVQCAGAG